MGKQTYILTYSTYFPYMGTSSTHTYHTYFPLHGHMLPLHGHIFPYMGIHTSPSWAHLPSFMGHIFPFMGTWASGLHGAHDSPVDMKVGESLCQPFWTLGVIFPWPDGCTVLAAFMGMHLPALISCHIFPYMGLYLPLHGRTLGPSFPLFWPDWAAITC